MALGQLFGAVNSMKDPSHLTFRIDEHGERNLGDAIALCDRARIASERKLEPQRSRKLFEVLASAPSISMAMVRSPRG